MFEVLLWLLEKIAECFVKKSITDQAGRRTAKQGQGKQDLCNGRS